MDKLNLHNLSSIVLNLPFVLVVWSFGFVLGENITVCGAPCPCVFQEYSEVETTPSHLASWETKEEEEGRDIQKNHKNKEIEK